MKHWKVARLILFLCCGLILMASILVAQDQDPPRIFAEYQEEDLATILDELEREYSFAIYHPAGVLPPVTRSASFSGASLPKVLDELLEGTGLGYLVYRSYLVVIADQSDLGRQYSPDYFSAVESLLSEANQAAGGQEEIYTIGAPNDIHPAGKAQMTGIVIDAAGMEPIIGATLSFPGLNRGTGTASDGSFEITLPIGRHKLVVSYLGYNTLNTSVRVFNDGSVEIALENVSLVLDEVVVEAEAANANVESAIVGVTRLKMEEIRKLPTFLGEIDVIKSLLQQPGVSNAGEGASGFNVRGGDVDQNLVLMDEHFVFNTSHALGFFSAFNSDLINRLTLYKGYIPAQFGGRLSSVLDVELKEGDREHFRMKGGIGMVSSRISAQGPVIKDKSSFIAGFRATYSDWVLGLMKSPEVKNSSASFYDANFKYSHRFNENNQLALSFYTADDDISFNNEFGFKYSTLGGQLTYRKVFSPKVFSAFSVTGSEYESTGTENQDTLRAATLYTRYRYLKLKEVLTLLPNERIELKAGFSSIYYKISPGQRSPSNEQSTIQAISLQDEQALESALFTNLDWAMNDRITASFGLRYTFYRYLGPRTYFTYQDPVNPSNESVTGEATASGGESIADLSSLEPRFSMRYLLSGNASLKFGYSRTSQYINQLSNLVTPTPVSIWQLSNQYIEPRLAHSFSLGYFRNFGDNQWETSIEAYYRSIDQLADYKDFALLTANPNVETELLRGTGQAYGAELSLKKKKGDFNGWLSYTFSRALQRVTGINGGDRYPAYYDKPHDLTVVTNWQITGRLNMALNFNYSQGRPITAPVAKYTTGGRYSILEYSARNQVRVPDYHRLDVALTLDKGYRKTQRLKHNWTLSLYNLYGRKNVYSVFFEPTTGLPKTIRLSVLGSAFVSLTVNFFYQ